MAEAGREATTADPSQAGRFVSGSILRHVVVMSATGAIGLMAIFFVDLLSLLYVSKLGDPALTAAVPACDSGAPPAIRSRKRSPAQGRS